MLSMFAVWCVLQAAPAQVDPAAYARRMGEGVDALKRGEFAQAIEAFKELEKIAPEDPTAPYNIACGLSLLGKKDEALAYLKKSVSLGFAQIELFETDPDLANVRGEKGYGEALADLKAKLKGSLEKVRRAAREEMRKALAKEGPLFAFGFDLTDIAGKKLSIAELKGTIVLVDVWGTWCPPCVREVPNLIKLQKEYGEKGVAVVGLACERVPETEAPAKVKAFVEKAGINYRCAVIDRDFLKQIPGFQGFPTLLVVDRAGAVRFLEVGYTDYEALAGWVEELLGAPSAEGGKVKAKKKSKKWF